MPDEWDGWVLHGHLHNNNLAKYPLIAHDRRRVNVGVDLLEFQPLSLETLTTVLDQCNPGVKLEDIEAVQAWVNDSR